MSATDNVILLVEDDPNDVLLLRRAFRKASLANPIHVVTDGEAAIAYLAGEGEYADRARHPLPVLVLLDLKLPRRNGHEVLEWLRMQPGIGRVRVAVLTSSAEAADVNRAFELGANAYLTKPADLDSLIEMARALDVFWMMVSERPELA